MKGTTQDASHHIVTEEGTLNKQPKYGKKRRIVEKKNVDPMPGAETWSRGGVRGGLGGGGGGGGGGGLGGGGGGGITKRPRRGWPVPKFGKIQGKGRLFRWDESAELPQKKKKRTWPLAFEKEKGRVQKTRMKTQTTESRGSPVYYYKDQRGNVAVTDRP